MKRSVTHGRSGKAHGLDYSLRRKNTCSSDLNDDIYNAALLFLRRIFISYRPAGKFCRTAKCFALRERIYLYDRSVNIIGKFAALLPYLINTLTALSYCAAQLIRNDRKSHVLHSVKCFGVGLIRLAVCVLHVKAHDVELAGCGNLRVKLTY